MSEGAFIATDVATGFQPDPRFGPRPTSARTLMQESPAERALTEAHAAGFAAAEALGNAQLAAALAARDRIELSLARLDAAMEEDLRRRMHAAIEQLCALTMAPLLADPGALSRRIAKAAAMLARADDERVLRLHPDDLALVGTALPTDLPVNPDPALVPGTVRIETAQGGVEDGPEHWQRQLAEALTQC